MSKEKVKTKVNQNNIRSFNKDVSNSIMTGSNILFNIITLYSYRNSRYYEQIVINTEYSLN